MGEWVQVEDWDLCPTCPQIPLEADSRLEKICLYKICTVALKLVRLLTGEVLSVHASICKVRYLTFLCPISLPSCTVEQLTRPSCVSRERFLQCLSLVDLRYDR